MNNSLTSGQDLLDKDWEFEIVFQKGGSSWFTTAELADQLPASSDPIYIVYIIYN